MEKISIENLFVKVSILKNYVRNNELSEKLLSEIYSDFRQLIKNKESISEEIFTLANKISKL